MEATSSSSRKMTRLVCSMMADASDANKYSATFPSSHGTNSVVELERANLPPTNELFIKLDRCVSVITKKKIINNANVSDICLK